MRPAGNHNINGVTGILTIFQTGLKLRSNCLTQNRLPVFGVIFYFGFCFVFFLFVGCLVLFSTFCFLMFGWDFLKIFLKKRKKIEVGWVGMWEDLGKKNINKTIV